MTPAADPTDRTGPALRGYWPSPWPGEDGGPARRQLVVPSAASLAGPTVVCSRTAIASSMVVLREPGEVYLLGHELGPEASAWVERIDPGTLDVIAQSGPLPGGPTWPGGMAAHANGSLHVVFGNHAHRLAPDLTVLATSELPRNAPYNSFVVMPDGHLVTKDFGGLLPGRDPDQHDPPPAELLVLHPETLEIVARGTVPEPSVARLSADGDTVYVVGTSSLFRVRWDGSTLTMDPGFAPVYRTLPGQTYGWDAVLALGAAWFLDNGGGSERYAGTFRGQGTNAAPLHLVRVDLATGEVALAEICGLPNGVVANPPLIDEARRIAVGFDSGNGVVTAFDIAADNSLHTRWTRQQNHAAHMLLFSDTGEVVTNDHDAEAMADAIVVLDIESGEERARFASGSPVQSVLFPAGDGAGGLYYCSFAAVARVRLAEADPKPV